MSTPHEQDAHDGHGEMAVGWMLRTLEPEEEEFFLDHVPDCDECRRFVGEVSPALESVARAVPQYDPPPGLRGRVLTAATAEQRVVEDGSAGGPDEPAADDDASGPDDATVVALRRRRSRRRWIARGVAVAAVAGVIAAVGGLTAANQSLRRERDAVAASAQEAERVVQMLDDAAAPGVRRVPLTTSTGEFVGLVADAGQGPQVLATGLPGNGADRTYVLWGLGGAEPVGLGAFDLPGSTSAVRSVRSPEQAAPFAGYAVSLEPGRTVPAAPTEIVASGQVGR